MDFMKKNWKGLLLCLAIALPSWFLGKALPVIGGPVFAILLGMAVTLILKDKTNLQPGITFTSKNQNVHAVPPEITKMSATIMKFQGASIGKGPGGPK